MHSHKDKAASEFAVLFLDSDISIASEVQTLLAYAEHSKKTVLFETQAS